MIDEVFLAELHSFLGASKHLFGLDRENVFTDRKCLFKATDDVVLIEWAVQSMCKSHLNIRFTFW